MLPEPIKKFIEIFSTLPSIGTRQATRLAFKLISSGRAKIDETAKAVDDLRYLKTCANCFFVHQNRDNLCDICRDSNRRQNIIAIVEKETDLISLERTKKFKGRYLVLGELSKTGVLESIQKLRLNHLKDWIKKQGGQAEEIIIAINPTTFGDLNASMIAKELSSFAKKITRLGRGIPTGGEIEFADEETLGQALDRRT
ncbi:MAG: recombination protein RecR [Parcubacteria group bacterium]|nr:recombination protein RecR [Parcubacteria group bacterium]